MRLSKSKTFSLLLVCCSLVSCGWFSPTVLGGIGLGFDSLPKKVGDVTTITATLFNSTSSCCRLEFDPQTEEPVAFIWTGKPYPIPYFDFPESGTREGLEMIEPLEDLPIGPLAKASADQSGSLVAKFKFKLVRQGAVNLQIRFGVQRKAEPGTIRFVSIYGGGDEFQVSP